MTLPRTVDFLKLKYGNKFQSCSPLGSGAWSAAFKFSIGDQDLVIRWSKFRESFDRDQYAVRFTQPGLPIPRIIDSGQFDQNYFCISEFVSGQFFESLTSFDLEPILPSLTNVFHKFKYADLSATTGFGDWNAEGKGAYSTWKQCLLDVKNDRPDRIIHGWKTKIESNLPAKEQYDRLCVELEKLVSFCPEKRHLIHSDLLNRNVLVHDQKISAVLDWGSSKFGDYLYDVAWFMFYEPWYPEFKKIKLMQHLIDWVTSNPDSQNWEQRLLCYQLHIGLESVQYNLYLQDWKTVQETLAHTQQLLYLLN